LEQCKKLAVENNAKIKNGNLEIAVSKQVKQAAFTNYFPSINATGMAFQFNKKLINFDVPGGNLPVYNGDPATIPLATEFAYFPGMSLSMFDKMKTGAIIATQPVFAGGRIYYGNKLAQLGIDISTQMLEMSTSEVLINTEEKYWLIVSLNDKMKTIEVYNRLLDTLYKDVSNAYTAGLINHNDVLKVALKQSELRVKKLKLEDGKKLATMSFCRDIGIKYDSLMILSDSAINNSIPISFYVDYQQALSKRVEYQLLQGSIKAEKLQTNIKRGEYLPEIAIGAGAFTTNMDNNTKWNNNSMIFCSVSIPITDWWEASHTLKKCNLKEQIAQNSADSTAELLILQMEKTWIDLQESYQEIQLAEEAIKLSEENLKITYDNYKSGIVGISDLLEAQAILQTSYNDLTEARCSYQIKIALYLQATGNYK
jgi:outer membrane protein